MENFGRYDPSESPILYHYCDLNAFLSIIQSKAIRLSDINTMNDYGEMHWAYDRFIEAANQKIDEYGKDFLDAYDKLVSALQLNTLPILSCFSMEGDVLSQWRAYAEDGAGVAIGFDGNLISKLSVRCARVVYDHTEQTEFHKHALAALFPMWKMSKTNPQAEKDFREFAFHCAIDMCLMKNPAFSEEKEVRVIRALAVKNERGQWYLSDEGGTSNDKPSRKVQKVYFRARRGGIVAYVDLPIGGLGKELIKEVVLGPKTENNGNEVSMALSANGYTGFKIRHSTATYR
jgi:hypothetical protein